MAFPFFYISNYTASQTQLLLDEDTSRHIVQVLRMKEGEYLNLTDGNGHLLNCEIKEAGKKSCLAEIKEIKSQKSKTKNISIAISLLKNTSRFEWFLEKATEIGVTEIIPLICERTEKEKFRHDRMNAICISAMLQSQQCWLPKLHEPQPFNLQTLQQFNHSTKLVAHCEEGTKYHLTSGGNEAKLMNESTIILIGPEGDFTKQEIQLTLQNNFTPVSLGETRLRTETAGIVAATLLSQI